MGKYIKDSLRHPAAESLREVIARQRAMGWRVLDDETVYLRRGGDSIALTGLSFDPALSEQRHDRHLPATGLRRAFTGVPQGLYSIVLAHVPQLWEQITAAGYGDLTLSGHVHAMQCKIRFGAAAGRPRHSSTSIGAAVTTIPPGGLSTSMTARAAWDTPCGWAPVPKSRS